MVEKECSINLPLMDKFSYPLPMLQYKTFKEFENDQPKVDDYDDNLIGRLAGLGIGESVFNMSMFQFEDRSTKVPYQNFETPPGWEEAFESSTSKYELEIIKGKLQKEWKKGNKIFPLEQDIFNAFKLCPPNKVKVLIIGQDPYPQMDTRLGVPIANGKAFSLRYGGDDTGSLNNIFTEIRRTFPGIPLEHGDLTSWAEQGVLLLNAQLTVNQNDAGSHTKLKIWDYWTEYIIKWICDNCPGVICLLWGSKAMSFTLGDKPAIGKKIFKRTCGHPSNKNTSATPFKDNGHFADVYYEIDRQNRVIYDKNLKLQQQGLELLPYIQQINWALVHPQIAPREQVVQNNLQASNFNMGAITNQQAYNTTSQQAYTATNQQAYTATNQDDQNRRNDLLKMYPHLNR